MRLAIWWVIWIVTRSRVSLRPKILPIRSEDDLLPALAAGRGKGVEGGLGTRGNCWTVDRWVVQAKYPGEWLEISVAEC